jgi:hypothetical protein
MVLGMTRGEIGLVLFIFALVYASGLLKRAGDRLGAWMSRRDG